MKGKFGKYTEERSIDKYLTKYSIYKQKNKVRVCDFRNGDS